MTPATILSAAVADGLSLSLTPKGTIKVIGEQTAVDRWLPTIRTHKPELLAALAANDSAPQDALAEAFEERAAIREFDGGFPRHEAERLARLDLAAMEPWGQA